VEFEIAFAAGRLAVTGDMTVYCASELKTALLEQVPADSPTLEVDLSQIGEIDTAGLQLLLMLSRHVQGRMTVLSPSPTVQAALALSHLNHLSLQEAA